ncbi:MAG: pyridoxine 5'-phosphate synthase [Candidatus Omnitrophica bacterium]|nr:pyridoxine 5'-phosphate synthase [Candidatus Omnitrophota bacterium]
MKLGVNIDHVATLREARQTIEPDPVMAALESVKAGADSIVCHLRKDRRHLQDSDLYALKQRLDSPLNMEMSVDPDIVDIACDVLPDQVTLVPENRSEVTTEGGLDAAANVDKVRKVVERLSGRGIRVSLFLDPEEDQISAGCEAGASIVELHTGRYAERFTHDGDVDAELRALARATHFGMDKGLTVAAGHGLTYRNVGPVTEIEGLTELNIGHSIIARSVFRGINEAVSKMKELIG